MRTETGRSRAQAVGALLRRQKLTLAVAESCTGGLVGDRITDVPGSSDYFLGGVVAYSNLAKIRLLGVKTSTLERSGAVSAATVKEMADGVRLRLKADYGIAVSGIAGPGGGTRAKPVGLVYVAVTAGRENRKRPRIVVERHLFSGSRRAVKEQATEAVLALLERVLRQQEG